MIIHLWWHWAKLEILLIRVNFDDTYLRRDLEFERLLGLFGYLRGQNFLALLFLGSVKRSHPILNGKKVVDSLILWNFETILKSGSWGGQNWSDGRNILFPTLMTLYREHVKFSVWSVAIHDFCTRYPEKMTRRPFFWVTLHMTDPAYYHSIHSD